MSTLGIFKEVLSTPQEIQILEEKKIFISQPRKMYGKDYSLEIDNVFLNTGHWGMAARVLKDGRYLNKDSLEYELVNIANEMLDRHNGEFIGPEFYKQIDIEWSVAIGEYSASHPYLEFSGWR